MPLSLLTLKAVEKKRKAQSLFAPVSFALCEGEGIAVQGHNGCGKTTLLDCISGIQKASAGQIDCTAALGYR